MKTNLGEEGTEQFIVTTCVDGKLVGAQPIHDPFIRCTISHYISRWDHFKAIFRPSMLKLQVAVDGTEGASRAIMTLDPVVLQKETAEILADRMKSREEAGVVGFCAEGSDVG